jgi:hypothetical protein
LAVAPLPIATAAPNKLLVQPPPLPMPNTDRQVALAVGAELNAAPAMVAAHAPAATAATSVWRAGRLRELMIILSCF